ncbi:unnamed protein product [Cuscuta europaea]|uniref:Uncharacterized protein n=1 Tax=Cuscuta europaea TaxID=41803 RepID=A0A9P0ZD57_CUSEU|nr:unnamed protein product [Cuscuta europaea]
MTLFSFRKLSNTKSAPRKKDDEAVKEKEGSCLRNKSSSVNREYMEAFRTKSYVEVYDKVQTQLLTGAGIMSRANTCGGAAEDRLLTIPSSSSSSSQRRLQLCHLSGAADDDLQYYYSSQPHDHHPLLNEYFLVSLEACKMCESLLKNVLHTRTNYDKNIKCATKGVSGRGVWSAEQLRCAYAHLESFSALKNPLSTASQVRFNEVQDNHFALLHRLTSRTRKLKRKMKVMRLLRKTLGATLAAGCAALALAFTLVAVHCAALCVLAGPGVVSLLLWKKGKKQQEHQRRRVRERGYMQLDAAAKGVYVLINDFGTMSRLVGRVYDETEHNRAIAGLCARKKNDEMVKEVVRDLAAHEAGFSDHLKELEQHIYLCFLNIIRSRRMVLQQIIN